MTFFLALKNTRLYFRKRLPLALFLAATLALLFIGNTVFSGTDAGMSRTFRTSLTADYSISSASEDAFNLFGSELPLLGEYFKMPVILEYDEVAEAAKKAVPNAQWQPLVVGAAKISLKGFSAGSAIFSADLPDYLAFFPAITLVKGSVPKAGEPALLLNERMYRRATEALGRAPEIGEKFLLTAAQENSFALREAPLAGVFAYPVYDPILENVSLLDVGTGRALAGYFVTQASAKTAAEASTGGSIDDLFADASDTKAPSTGGISFTEVTESLAVNAVAPQADPKTWNFLLVRSPSVGAGPALAAALQSSAAPTLVRDWRDTAGGNAKIVWFIQLIFNLGLVFISLVAGLIVMNSMSLAVAERTREIGTMRSLGAGSGWVARLVAYETVLMVTGAGAFGVVVGAGILALVSLLGGISIDNPFLASLLGTQRYLPQVSPVIMVQHVLLSLALGALATVLPARKALKVTPLQAMARE